MKSPVRRARRVGFAVLVVAALLVSAAAFFVVRSTATAHAQIASNAAANAETPFEASSVDTLVSVDCSAYPICHFATQGTGEGTQLGKTETTINGTVFMPGGDCDDHSDVVTFTPDDGSGTLTILETGHYCVISNGVGPHAVETGSLTWTVTGGTGRLAGASGSGTTTAVLPIAGPEIRGHSHYSGHITLA